MRRGRKQAQRSNQNRPLVYVRLFMLTDRDGRGGFISVGVGDTEPALSGCSIGGAPSKVRLGKADFRPIANFAWPQGWRYGRMTSVSGNGRTRNRKWFLGNGKNTGSHRTGRLAQRLACGTLEFGERALALACEYQLPLRNRGEFDAVCLSFMATTGLTCHIAPTLRLPNARLLFSRILLSGAWLKGPFRPRPQSPDMTCFC
jgi:hypothetical protein